MFRIWSLTLIARGIWHCKWRSSYLLVTVFYVWFSLHGIYWGTDSWMTWLALLTNGFVTISWTNDIWNEVEGHYWLQIHALTGTYDQVLVFHILYPKLRQDPWFGGIGVQVWGFGSVYSRRKFE